MLCIDGAACGRIAAPTLNLPDSVDDESVVQSPGRRVWRLVEQAFGWMVGGYQRSNAGDLASAVAFNALVAFVPTFLLCFAVAGLILHRDQVLTTALYASVWGLPSGASSDAFEAVLAARRNSSWLGALSLAGFAWTGAGFVSSLGRAMNRIYGVPGCGYMCERRRGFFVILAFGALFVLALLASILPTLFVNQDLPFYFERWALAAGWYQVLGYVLAFFATVALFGMLYRVVPNAGQRFADVWPGILTAAVSFVGMAQVFPIYLRLIGGANRYGAVFGLISLLVVWFYLLAHVLLFGTYVNATFQRYRRRRAFAHGRPCVACLD